MFYLKSLERSKIWDNVYFNYTKNGLGKVTIIIIFFIYQFIYIKNLRLQILFMIL